jgi:Xaa-Pro aminopeptidase
MEAENVDSLIVFGDSTVGNPDLCYLVGASLPRGGIYLKRVSKSPVLVVSNIDVGSARQGRVRDVKTYADYDFESFMTKYSRDEARVRFYQRLIRDSGLSGKTVVAGRNDISNSLLLIDSLRKRGVRIVGEKTPTIVERARETKDQVELEKMKVIADKSDRVVVRTLDFLRKVRTRGRRVHFKALKLKVGDVRRLVNRFLSEEGLIAPEDTIFAAGKASSDPHYRGEDSDIVRPGEPIVFDIFPCEPDGYWHDCTRTISFGNPTRNVKKMYATTLEAQSNAVDMIREGVSSRDVMTRTCEFFQKSGYSTPLAGSKRSGVKGFIHGLGHGVGLTIGERPYLTMFGDSPLKKASVVTVEPGLYDPRIGGVRIEDTVLVRSSNAESLTRVGKDMVI